jgi:hypothetical protein
MWGGGLAGMARPWLAQAGGAGSGARVCRRRGAGAGAGEWAAEPRRHCRACAGKALSQLSGSAPEPGALRLSSRQAGSGRLRFLLTPAPLGGR